MSHSACAGFSRRQNVNIRNEERKALRQELEGSVESLGINEVVRKEIVCYDAVLQTAEELTACDIRPTRQNTRGLQVLITSNA